MEAIVTEWWPSLRLTPRQRELLSMDSYCEYPEERSPAPELAPLRAELQRGTIITLTNLVMAHLAELADRDDEPREQAVYRRLASRARFFKTNGGKP